MPNGFFTVRRPGSRWFEKAVAPQMARMPTLILRRRGRLRHGVLPHHGIEEAAAMDAAMGASTAGGRGLHLRGVGGFSGAMPRMGGIHFCRCGLGTGGWGAGNLLSLSS